MHTRSIEPWIHDHAFGQDKPKAGERRTLIVIGITAATMVLEIGAGMAFGSMALLADGLHMGSHASALAISAFAYFYTRRHARDERFNFGTGKVNSLAAFASAVLLVVFALIMAVESVGRFIHPVEIVFNQAIIVACVGLVVNGVCLFILGGGGHSHTHGPGAPHAHGASRAEDHNLLAAYFHVLADALTSLLAVFALLAGKYLDQGWMDPLMGIVGAVLVTRWSVGLLRQSSRVLLDMRAPDSVLRTVRESVETRDGNRISDLHVWAVGPGIYAAEWVVVTASPKDPDHYVKLVPETARIVHATVEVRRCPSPHADAA